MNEKKKEVDKWFHLLLQTNLPKNKLEEYTNLLACFPFHRLDALTDEILKDLGFDEELERKRILAVIKKERDGLDFLTKSMNWLKLVAQDITPEVIQVGSNEISRIDTVAYRTKKARVEVDLFEKTFSSQSAKRKTYHHEITAVYLWDCCGSNSKQKHKDNCRLFKGKLTADEDSCKED